MGARANAYTRSGDNDEGCTVGYEVLCKSELRLGNDRLNALDDPVTIHQAEIVGSTSASALNHARQLLLIFPHGSWRPLDVMERQSIYMSVRVCARARTVSTIEHLILRAEFQAWKLSSAEEQLMAPNTQMRAVRIQTQSGYEKCQDALCYTFDSDSASSQVLPNPSLPSPPIPKIGNKKQRSIYAAYLQIPSYPLHGRSP